MERVLHSFGRVNPATRQSLSAGEAVAALEAGRVGEGGLLAYGNGRSYGDVCQNTTGALADMRSRNRIVSFDPENGLLRAEAGAMLCDVIEHAGPHGWFPAVVPGTQFVTLGGAVANDVHGKNHHRRGTFGLHVEQLTLLRSDGSRHVCSREADTELFCATIGGMGLTGLILDVTIRLMKVGSADVVERVTPFSSLSAYFALAQTADAENEYAVAWIDQLARGSEVGRGVLLTANHADAGSPFKPVRRARLSVPFQPPFNVLNRASISLFNRAYRAAKARAGKPHPSHYASYFFPLDGVAHWNRLYGPRGLHQHQSVIPPDSAEEAVAALLSAAQEAGQASFLTVLKRFGGDRSPGLLSFPREGYTLTLDFPNRGAATQRLLERLDEITVAAGGAVNPYKDSRMAPETFAASFPGWHELERRRDPAFLSDFWRRTALKLAAGEPGFRAATTYLEDDAE